MIYTFDVSPLPTLTEVGGKGLSLMRMTQAGFPIPPGFALSVAFFASWITDLQATPEWQAVQTALRRNENLHPTTDALKAACAGLTLTGEQEEQLAKALQALPNDSFLAVRSSSPEEDLEGASFAGGYETALGVTPAALPQAIRSAFSSAFDERVFVYKQQHGFVVEQPRMAVIVQQQINSEVAGVGFSLNPLTNDYDEAVINANWGLGESVVSGAVTPDHFLVNKVDGKIIEKKLGAKQVSIGLDPAGGTFEQKDHPSSELTLNDTQLRELTETIGRIEAHYEKPIDIEWAYAGGRLHILQARPITAYVPLPPEMVTKPGEPRRLYADGGLSEGMTINGPISPLGLAWSIDMLYASMLKDLLGIDDFTPEGGLVFPAGCRFYANLSNIMRLGVTPKLMARNTTLTDALLGEILANIDAKTYRAEARPPWLQFRLLLSIPKVLWMMRWFLWRPLVIFIRPKHAWRKYRRDADAFETEFAEHLDYGLPLDEFAETYSAIALRDLFDVTLPSLIAGLVSPAWVVPKKPEELRNLAMDLTRGVAGNIVVEQGIALFRLAKLLQRSDFKNLTGLADRIEKREMPAIFLTHWDTFLHHYGCRGPLEMDIASPRYADGPALALRQMSFMAVDEADFDPEQAHQRNVTQRWRAYEELLRRLGWFRRILLRRIHRVFDLFAGTRDTPKHHLVLLTHAIRKRALIEGKRLVGEGRLDAPEDVFDLTFHDLKAARKDPALDLRKIATERTRFARQLAAHVTEFPQVIDSRGRILRPAPHAGKAGELVGMPVSPGSVVGPVKVLRSPHDKPVEKGDVLVAYTTDPGWTPLFVNAAAIVLEVGGILQHGAVIAREYGKPCVAGVDRVVSKLRDGQAVEVDGTAGTVRLLS
jgi:phosphohistidine swiveling domain-containing protein